MPLMQTKFEDSYRGLKVAVVYGRVGVFYVLNFTGMGGRAFTFSVHPNLYFAGQ